MLIHVQEWNWWTGGTHRLINSDLIKTVDFYTCGNFHRDRCAKITFVDGSVMKVTDSVEEISKKTLGLK
jgi:hypothetical protein